MSNLSNAFNSLLKLKQRTMTIERPGSGPLATARDILMSPSNYQRNLSAPENTVIEGREFVVSSADLVSSSFPIPKRGDRIKDPVLGLMVVSESWPMFGLGGEILGYRVRTS